MTEPHHRLNLNEEQLQAVTSLKGPLLILAGAGSGKTRVLTRRIAELLYQGVSAKNILAVTFTNKAASEMKERVIELVGEPGDSVWISTFHSTCGRILRKDIEPLGYTRRFSIYDDDDQARIVRQIVRESGMDPKNNPPSKFLNRIDRYKNKHLSIEDVIAQRRSHINDPFLRIWRQYEESLRAADAIDFNDLIGLVVTLFQKHPEVLEQWRERFQYILVDEYQDTNHVQYQLLSMLSATHRNLAVVGDDDQSIYGFRGADIANILGFERDYPEATVIRMERNYRSSNNILALANAVVKVNSERIEKQLWTDADAGPLVNFMEASNPDTEANMVAQGILQLRRQGYAYKDIAIIYRTNATTRVFERAMREYEIPYVPVGGRKFYEHREVRDILSYLRLLVNPSDDAALLRIINVPARGIGVKTVATLREEALNRGEPLLKTARALAAGSTRRAKALARFIHLIDHLAHSARLTHPASLVGMVLQESRYLAELEELAGANQEDSSSRVFDKEKMDARRRITNLQVLIREAQSLEDDGTLSPIDLLQYWLDRMCLAGNDDKIPEEGKVALMTVHNSKGLEYPVVFVTQMIEGLFPHARSVDTKAGIEEERRLAYVAFTRARECLIITWSGQSFFWTHGTAMGRRPAVPSRFLFGIPPEVCIGNLPIQKTTADDRKELSKKARSEALNRFINHHASMSTQPSMPEDSYTLIDLEDPEQLRPGVRILHPQKGLGEIRGIRGNGEHLRVLVSFGDRSPTLLSLRSESIQIIVE